MEKRKKNKKKLNLSKANKIHVHILQIKRWVKTNKMIKIGVLFIVCLYSERKKYDETPWRNAITFRYVFGELFAIKPYKALNKRDYFVRFQWCCIWWCFFFPLAKVFWKLYNFYEYQPVLQDLPDNCPGKGKFHWFSCLWFVRATSQCIYVYSSIPGSWQFAW